jgi:hypothetical protein
MNFENFAVYHNLRNRVLPGMQKEKRRYYSGSTGELTPVSYPTSTMGATGRLYSGRLRVAPASSSGQP